MPISHFSGSSSNESSAGTRVPWFAHSFHKCCSHQEARDSLGRASRLRAPISRNQRRSPYKSYGLAPMHLNPKVLSTPIEFRNPPEMVQADPYLLAVKRKHFEIDTIASDGNIGPKQAFDLMCYDFDAKGSRPVGPLQAVFTATTACSRGWRIRRFPSKISLRCIGQTRRWRPIPSLVTDSGSESQVETHNP